ncbi:MAG TPA: MFS transporter [Saprospiraceae bacterium]|nr:MFS transporter [Saprospiraceae bacterium]HMQ84993.1 MFS transporter [Saprospiraceae bacterium]
MQKPRPPFSQILVFGLGQLGWSLVSFGAANLLVYYYMPPEAEAGSNNFPSYIYQGAILGFATLVGLINFGGRIFDMITDPLIAAWSDRVESKFGKRKKLMAIAALPLALFSFLMFWPLTQSESSTNAAWLVGCILLFYLAFTIYAIPFLALVSELGHHPPDRMRISTVISIAWSIGFLIGSSAYAIQSWLENYYYYSPEVAFQWVVGIFALVSFVLMVIPLVFLQENKYCYQSTTDISAFKSARLIFSNRNFNFFLVADLMYWLALTFIQMGISYYVILLFGFDKAMASLFLALGFLCSFLFYWPINIVVARTGKKKVVMAAFLTFSLIFAVTVFMPYLPISKNALFYGLAISSGFPLAAFGVMPTAIIADIVYEQEQLTGQQQAGMFYAIRNFMMKAGISVANFIFPSLLLMGKSADNPMGVKVSLFLALLFCALGFFCFSRYKHGSLVAQSA